MLEVTNGYPPLSFSLNNSEPDDFGIYNLLLGNTEHLLTITDRYGCRLDSLVYLSGPPVLQLNIGQDQQVELGMTASVSAVTNFVVASWEWTNEAQASLCPTLDCTRLQWVPVRNEYVYLTAYDANGCSVSDSVWIAVLPNYEVYVPNVFSPNQDGVNDRFKAYGPSSRIVSFNKLTVFDRWGKMVYTASGLLPDGLNQGWDGTIKGEEAPPGAYVWQLEVEFIDGFQRDMSGAIILMR
ncbi:MAG: gliding motility-associated C-terminal domain-containing protein [Saprospiraceae bacterium]